MKLNFETFTKEQQLTQQELVDFVGLDFFDDFCNHVREAYKIAPKLSYSNCAMDKNIWRGWNLKYQKSGKSLCTIYPQREHFLVLVPGKAFTVKTKEDLGEVLEALEFRKADIGLKIK
ncbi:MAG: DUF3788 domain-containing protein [Firmicutes bacterium]|nr:DUF3788 domain-containing protein [Bacillota bacterium]